MDYLEVLLLVSKCLGTFFWYCFVIDFLILILISSLSVVGEHTLLI